METVKGQVVSVTRGLAGSNLIVDAVATDTELFLDDVSDFDEEGGSVTVDGDVLTYLSVDQEASSITLSAGLAGGLMAYETFISIYPDAPTHTAEVLLTDGSGITVPALVPQNLRALLHEGVREPDGFEAVTLMDNGDEWMVLDIEWQAGTHDASTVPIIVSNADGESARVDADGFSTYTNDPVPLRTIPGRTSLFATDGTHIYADPADNGMIRKFDGATGIEVTTGGFPITGFNPGDIAVDGGFIYTKHVTGSPTIRKFNASTGAEVLVGFPIVGGFDFLAASGGFLYASDNPTNDIRKFDASTGAEVLVGFPIVGTFNWLAAADGYIYADSATTQIRKFDAATGTEVVAGFPISGTFNRVSAHGGYIFAQGNADKAVHKFDATTGEEVMTSGFPLEGPFNPSIAVDSDRLYATDDVTAEIRIFNNSENYRSTLADSSDGTYLAHAITVSDLTSTGDATFEGTLSHTPTFTDVTFNGSWTNFGSPYEEVSYTKVAGRVYLRGAAKHATTSTTGTVFTLPEGYRPTKQRRFTVGAGATGGIALFTVNNSGVVSIAAYASGGSAAIVEFDLISFDVSP